MVTATNLDLPDVVDLDAFLSFDIDGRPAKSEPDVGRRKFSREYFYSDDQAECNILFSGLLLANAFPMSASKRESPDFEVTLRDGKRIYVEITQAAADARRESPIGDLNGGINEWVRENPAVRDRVRDWHIIVNIPNAPGRLAEPAYRELQEFLRDADFADYDLDQGRSNGAVPAALSALQNLDTTVSTKHSIDNPMVLVTVAPGTAADPWDGADLVIARIDSKRNLARTWPERPLWLIVDISTVTHPPMTMGILAKNPPSIEPFARVIICSGRFGRRGLRLE